jgi:hypothetical protein
MPFDGSFSFGLPASIAACGERGGKTECSGSGTAGRTASYKTDAPARQARGGPDVFAVND